jgi:O-antigen ligase
VKSFPLARASVITVAVGAFADLAQAALSLRLILASVHSAGFSAVLLTGVAMAIGWRFAGQAFIAFGLAASAISGLSQISLLPVPGLLLLLNAGLWWGITLRRLSEGKLPSPAGGGVVPSACDILRIAVAVSLVRLLLDSNQWDTWWDLRQSTTTGYGDRLYPWTAALVWMQGLSFARVLFTVHDEADAREANAMHWLGPLARVTVISMGGFVVLQWLAGIPERWTPSGFQSPYEDISSFGSIAVACAIYLTATLRPRDFRPVSLSLVLAAAAWVFVGLSWSRAAWLAGGTFGLAAVFLRAPPRRSIFLVVAAVLAWLAVATTANAPFWQRSTYGIRIVQLARLENPLNKDPSRVFLYRRAFAMMAEKPFVGHGIGSFYNGSLRFARNDDPWRSQRDFAHNFLLQFGAELGVPAAALLVAILGICAGRVITARRLAPGALAPAAAALALGAYLQTQLTANSLNIYPSNQIFFWFLVAALAGSMPRKAAPHAELG